MKRLQLLAASLSLALGACGDSQDAMPDATTTPTPTMFKLHVDNIAPWTVLESGAAAMKTDGTTGAAAHGQAFEITFTAGKNQKVSFATMFGESNDWFFGPGPDGLALYDANGQPIAGDVTSQVTLWNAGTEIDQEPGVGDSVGPNQPDPTFGAADPDPTVRELGTTITLSDGSTFVRPATADMIKVTLAPVADRTFKLRIENVSTVTTLQTSLGAREIHLSPPVWAVHLAPAPLFAPGSPDRALGLELVAESGRGAMLASSLHALSGVATPISPGVWAVHRAPEPLYGLGLADRGLGLEHLAEDGNNAPLAAAMTSAMTAAAISSTGSFDIPVGATAKGPATAGHGFELDVAGLPGDRVSFATMFGMSDDWFFATRPEGIALFDAEGQPMTGDVTDQIAIYDAGTEVDEKLAIGPDTEPQQPAPNTGAADPIAQVREVSDAVYGVPASAHLRVTLELP